LRSSAEEGRKIAGHLEIPAFSETDLEAESLLSPGWVEKILTAAQSAGTPAVLTGGSATSLEPSGVDIHYQLLDGVAVEQELPWLGELYRGPLAALASKAAGRPMVASKSIESGINVNILSGPGGRYELHYDSNPLTGLLFVTDHDEASGGQLQFKLDGHNLNLDPHCGTFITFDARWLPHAVTPLTRDSLRITAPMNFYIEGEDQRPAGLDDYLYGENREQEQEAESGSI
jgi:hypothetical protein